MSVLPPLPKSWQVLAPELKTPYMQALLDQIANDAQKQTVFPPVDLRFKAFELTPLEQVKVVLVGQDPYFRPSQAMGLSFSVPKGVKVPPSLKNIYRELSDSGMGTVPDHGDLTHWAEQGVLMLNTALTVVEGKAGSHLKKGWLEFTQQVITLLNAQPQPIVFVAWGAFAHKVCDPMRAPHCVIRTSHPSPLGARKGNAQIPAFLGSDCFRAINEQLKQWGHAPIQWLV